MWTVPLRRTARRTPQAPTINAMELIIIVTEGKLQLWHIGRAFDVDGDLCSVDEGFVGTVVTCGLGACVASVQSTCVGGVDQGASDCSNAMPGASATDESCNGVDDNCNGRLVCCVVDSSCTSLILASGSFALKRG